MALDTVLLGQGVPFFHLGDDLLRSKSMDANSYDSGDWFNRVDWSGSHQRAGRPASPAPATTRPTGPSSRASSRCRRRPPGRPHIASASAHVQEMLRVRKSSPLFRLTTGADVMKRVDFLNVGPGPGPRASSS